MEILRLTLRISEKSEVEEKEIEVIKETPKTYKIKNGVIAKSKLMQTYSIFRNTIYNENPIVSFYTYCLVEDRNEAFRVLLERVRKQLKHYTLGRKI